MASKKRSGAVTKGRPASRGPGPDRLRPSPVLLAAFGIGIGLGVAGTALALWLFPLAGGPEVPEELRSSRAQVPAAKASAKDSADPMLEFDVETIDFGTIGQSAEVEHVLTATNIGDVDIVIEEVKAS